MPKKIEYKRRKLLGLCVDCSNKSTHGIYCEKCRRRHLESDKSKREKRVAEGMCFMCGSIKEQLDKAKCNACLEKMNSYVTNMRQSRLNENRCIDCGTDSIHKRCCTCHFKMISGNVFGTTSLYGDLENIFNEQKELCPYTGRKLCLQENCELDHILPRSKGGPNEIKNFQWVHRDVNKMKHDLTQEEFIVLLKEIMNHFVKTSTP